MLRRELVVALGLVACGYHVVDGRGAFGVQRLTIVPFEELEPAGVAGDIAQQLARALASGGVILTLDRSTADGVLSGTVDYVRTTGSATAAGIGAYQVDAQVTARLVDARGQIRWQDSVSAREDFLPAAIADGPLANEANRRRALSRMAEKLARALHERLLLSAGGA